jgi:hypothetical protein
MHQRRERKSAAGLEEKHPMRSQNPITKEKIRTE